MVLAREYSTEEIKGLLESILFVSGKPVNVQKLCLRLNISVDFLSRLVDKLNEQYIENFSGLFILKVAGGYQLVTNPRYRNEIGQVFLAAKDEEKLPQSAMEILAIIAYKQPISKEQINKIRSVNSVRSLRILLGYKLIEPVSTDALLGEVLYGTNKRFLEAFRLNSLSELPPLELFD